MAKHSEISPVISVEFSATGVKNLLSTDAMSCAVSADAIKAIVSSEESVRVETLLSGC